MLKVEVDEKQAASAEIRKGKSEKGKPWEFTSQPAWVFQPGAKYPIEIQFTLPDGVTHYPAGIYQLDFEALLTQGNFNRMAIDERLAVLKPAK